MTMILGPIMKHRNNPFECDSTEDMLYAIEQANIRLENETDLQKDICIFSMDAEALFPSLHLKYILDGIRTLIEESSLEFNNIDYKEVTKYVSIMYPEKLLDRIILFLLCLNGL